MLPASQRRRRRLSSWRYAPHRISYRRDHSRADAVAFALSPRSATSPDCQWEVDETARLDKRLIPMVAKPLGDAPWRRRSWRS